MKAQGQHVRQAELGPANQNHSIFLIARVSSFCSSSDASQFEAVASLALPSYASSRAAVATESGVTGASLFQCISGIYVGGRSWQAPAMASSSLSTRS